MSWRYVSRSDLLEHLDRAGLSGAGVDGLRQWLRGLLVDADLEVEDSAAPLIHAAVERLDVASASDVSLKQLAEELYRLLRAVPDESLAKELIPLIEERERVVELLEKALAGRISRTAFLSYVAERNWSTGIKESMARMDSTTLQELHRAITSHRYETLPALLSTSQA